MLATTSKPANRFTRDDWCSMLEPSGPPLSELLKMAGDLRDQHHGRVVSVSRNVFLPLTNLCRDVCTYCTFRRDPDDAGAQIMTTDQVLSQVRRAQYFGCAEALFSLGDRPEAVFPEMRRRLASTRHRTTLSYLADVCKCVLTDSNLIPHSNPGLMPSADLQSLRRWNGSLGLMLETASNRLSKPGMPHERAPDKLPARRLKTIEEAGRLSIPFTTGVLFGIGETPVELVDSLLAIRQLHRCHGHIQEVIVQNFRAKPDTPMSRHREPPFDQVLRTAAVARLVLGDMNLQVPPNLSGPDYARLLASGINDWGGVSPLTPDFINPEAPWPHLNELKRRTEEAGFVLRERLAVYPAFLERAAAGSRLLAERLRAMADRDGFRRGAS
jgi:FO synthase